MSLAMRATTSAMKVAAVANRLRGAPGLIAALSTRSYPEPAPVSQSLRRRFHVEHLDVAGRTVVRLTPRHGASGKHLIYTHGGAYVLPLGAPHWWIIDRATRDTGVTISVPLYGLAPEHDHRQGYDFLSQVFDQVAAECGAKNITLAGDSAGAGLALGQTLNYRTGRRPLPAQVILFSPWLDITMSHPAVRDLEPLDPMLNTNELIDAGRLWANGANGRNPLLSPQFADVDQLPPVHIFQGGHDLFAADAHTLAHRLREAGNGGTMQFAPDGFHVYVGAVFSSESRAAMRAVRELLA